ncbi:MAG: hypothetical protein V3S08_00490 [Phycisphaerales bacterium]
MRCSIAIVSFVFAAALPAADVQPMEEPGVSGWVVLDERPGDGEQCLVCRKRVYDEDVVEIRFKGRTFFVGKPFMGDFEADPARYFARIQARSALFDENAFATDRPMAYGWLWLGGYVLAGMLCSASCAYIAVCKGLTPLRWFFSGLFGNVAGLGLVMFVPRGDAARLPAGIPAGFAKVPTTRAPVACPSCGTANHPSATRCADCHKTLTPTVTAETGRIAE